MKKWLFSTLVGSMGLGCGPVYQPMASHTIAVGENQEVDVIWVQRLEKDLVRCQNTAQGPVCQVVTLK